METSLSVQRTRARRLRGNDPSWVEKPPTSHYLPTFYIILDVYGINLELVGKYTIVPWMRHGYCFTLLDLRQMSNAKKRVFVVYRR